MAYRSLYTCLRLLPLQQLKARTLSPPILSYQISELAPLPSTIAGAKTIKSFWDCGGGNGGSSGQSITLRCEYLIDPTDPRCRSQPIPIQSSGSGGTVVGSPGLPRSLSRLQSIGGQSPPLGSWHRCPPLPLFVIIIIFFFKFCFGKVENTDWMLQTPSWYGSVNPASVLSKSLSCYGRYSDEHNLC